MQPKIRVLNFGLPVRSGQRNRIPANPEALYNYPGPHKFLNLTSTMRNAVRNIGSCILALLAAAAFTGCEKSGPDTPDTPEVPEAALSVTSESPLVEISENGDRGTVAFPAEGGEAALKVETDRPEWGYETDADWLTADKKPDGLVLTADKNETRRSLSGTLTVFCETEDKRLEIKFSLTQAGAGQVTLKLSSESGPVELNEDGTSGTALFPASSGSAEITVETNMNDWEAFSSNEGWCTVTKNGSTLLITAKENVTVFERTSVITVRAGDAGNHAQAVIEASQASTGANMILEVHVHDGEGGTGNNLILPFDHTSSGALVNCVIDWGDGSVPERVVTGYPSHEYDRAGTYQVSVTGTVTVILGNYTTHFPTAYRSVIKGVKQWGNLGLRSMKYGFYYFDGLEYLAEPGPETFAVLENIYGCFEKCVNLKNIPEGMFANAPVLTEAYSAFSGCESVETIPDRVFAGCSLATRFSMVFKNCKSAKSIGENVFAGCTASTAFLQAFYGCESIEEIPAGLFADASACTDFSNAFAQCKSLKSIPSGLFAGSPGAKNFMSVFNGCESLSEIPSELFAAHGEATNMGMAFSGCSGIKTIPEGLFAGNPSVTSFSAAFQNCASLAGIPTGLFDANTRATNFSKTFSGCTAVTGESPYTTVNGVKVHLYERSVPDFTAPTSFKSCFAGCTGLSDYEEMKANHSAWTE